ncbi:MAG: glycerol-3-phosphate dehydrogenase [Deltaproteobacteria bacterium]|nr:glycerol-3-phosphate dehydrogenase [Deltaproteobacteria bacterium]
METERYFDGRARRLVLDEIADQTFDLVIIGGGINGAGVAHDASLRGRKVLLLEQRDLAFGTSSRSSKLIHGGLRYLESYQFRLVFEGTNERAALRKIAPHLVRPLLFALPVYEGGRFPLWMMDVGLWMYDGLSLFKAEKKHITLRSPKRILEREPLLNPEGLTGGIIYYDCMTDDARMTLENALAASQLGAPVITRAQVTAIEGQNGELATVHFRDRLSGRELKVFGKGVVNCTGAWTDHLRQMAQVESAVIRPTKGVHVVVEREKLHTHHANALVAPQDGRVFFAIPWSGRTVIGTTDTDWKGDPSELSVTRADVEYLLTAVNHNFPSAKLVPNDVFATWAGLRPLIQVDQAASESEVPREHQIYTDGRMVTVAGGKLTTYRRMAAETAEAALAAAGLPIGASKSHKALLPGARGISHDFDALAETIAKEAELPADIAARLANVYAARAPQVLRYLKDDRKLAERVAADRDVIWAEVLHAVDHELALSVDDILVRRTSLSLTAKDQATGAAERVADLIGPRLGWGPGERQAALDEYAHSIALSRAFRS